MLPMCAPAHGLPRCLRAAAAVDLPVVGKHGTPDEGLDDVGGPLHLDIPSAHEAALHERANHVAGAVHALEARPRGAHAEGRLDEGCRRAAASEPHSNGAAAGHRGERRREARPVTVRTDEMQE